MCAPSNSVASTRRARTRAKVHLVQPPTTLTSAQSDTPNIPTPASVKVGFLALISEANSGFHVRHQVGRGSGERGVTPPRKFFGDFGVKMAYFHCTFGAKFRFFFYDQNAIEIHLEYKHCHGD